MQILRGYSMGQPLLMAINFIKYVGVKRNEIFKPAKKLLDPLHINTSRYFGGWEINTNPFSAYGCNSFAANYRNAKKYYKG